jgi:hypothetical protein
MVKTQIQIPDRLYREAKRIAQENEMSFAEVVRRGIEVIVQHFPSGRQRATEWRPPKPHNLGKALVREDHWTTLSHE